MRYFDTFAKLGLHFSITFLGENLEGERKREKRKGKRKSFKEIDKGKKEEDTQSKQLLCECRAFYMPGATVLEAPTGVYSLWQTFSRA